MIHQSAFATRASFASLLVVAAVSAQAFATEPHSSVRLPFVQQAPQIGVGQTQNPGVGQTQNPGVGQTQAPVAGACPESIYVGMKGDSFASGVRFTVATRDLLAPGASLMMQRSATGHLWTAPLKSEYAACNAATMPVQLWSNASYQVMLANGQLSVILIEMSPSFQVTLVSGWNNQAIFDVSEIL